MTGVEINAKFWFFGKYTIIIVLYKKINQNEDLLWLDHYVAAVWY